MNIIKKQLADFIGLILVFVFGRTALSQYDNSVMSIYFHNPSLKLFKSIIHFLRRKNFSFISEEEYYDILTGVKKRSPKSVFISFDDGWRGNLALVSVMEEYKIPATFFIPVKPVITGNFWWEYAPVILADNPIYKSVEDLKKIPNIERMNLVKQARLKSNLVRSCINLPELKKLNENELFTIGSHTYHHPISIRCNSKELDFEYGESKKILEEWLGVEIKSFSFPNGDYNARDLKLLLNYNYRMAFTVNPELSSESTSVYQIPRISINSNGGKYENIARLLRLWHKYVQPVQRVNNKHIRRIPKLVES